MLNSAQHVCLPDAWLCLASTQARNAALAVFRRVPVGPSHDAYDMVRTTPFLACIHELRNVSACKSSILINAMTTNLLLFSYFGRVSRRYTFFGLMLLVKYPYGARLTYPYPHGARHVYKMFCKIDGCLLDFLDL